MARVRFYFLILRMRCCQYFLNIVGVTHGVDDVEANFDIDVGLAVVDINF
jgi:hypothetical protein